MRPLRVRTSLRSPFVASAVTGDFANNARNDASSSRATLFNMLVATGLLLPIILVYTTFIYRVLRGRVSQKDVEADHASY